MSFGRITGHLMYARRLALDHDSTSDMQRLGVEAIVLQIDVLLLLVRRIHHRTNLGQDDE
jgi:hypothetical protein